MSPSPPGRRRGPASAGLAAEPERGEVAGRQQSALGLEPVGDRGGFVVGEGARVEEQPAARHELLEHRKRDLPARVTAIPES